MELDELAFDASADITLFSSTSRTEWHARARHAIHIKRMRMKEFAENGSPAMITH